MNYPAIDFDNARTLKKSFELGNASVTNFLFRGEKNDLLHKVAKLGTRCESDLANRRYAQLDFELSEMMRCYREHLNDPVSALDVFDSYGHAASRDKGDMVLSELEASKAYAELNHRAAAFETPEPTIDYRPSAN